MDMNHIHIKKHNWERIVVSVRKANQKSFGIQDRDLSLFPNTKLRVMYEENIF